MPVIGQYKSGQIRIPRVTCDIYISVTGTNDTTPVIKTLGKAYNINGEEIDVNQYFCTIQTVDFDREFISSSCSIKYILIKESTMPATTTYFVGFNNGIKTTSAVVTFDNSNASSIAERTVNLAAQAAGHNQFACTLSSLNLDDSYAYVDSTGQVLFAGVNTPYYGKHYIYDD